MGEQWIQRQNLAGAALAGGGDGRHGGAVEHVGDRLGDAGGGGGVAFEEIGEPCEDDAAHHPVGKIVAKGDRGGERFDAGVAVALFQRQALAGLFAHGSGDAVNDHRWVAIDHLEEGGAAAGDFSHCRVGDADLLALPGDSIRGVEIDVPAIVENDGQDFTKYDPSMTFPAGGLTLFYFES